MERKISVSLFASSIRPHLCEDLFKSLEGTTVGYEVVFAGNTPGPFMSDWPLKYIITGSIKPAQCYEVARRECKGEVVIWVADDCEFPNDVIGKAYRFYKENCSRKDVVCLQTKEHYDTWQTCDITCHKFFAASDSAPKMAPIGMINREYFQELGGIDRRFVSGQWDNDLMMRVYGDGGKLFHFSEESIEIDHAAKHDPKYGFSDKRPFAQFYVHDRRILEGAWGQRRQMKYSEFPNFTRFDEGFEPYENKDLLTVSQSHKGMWE